MMRQIEKAEDLPVSCSALIRLAEYKDGKVNGQIWFDRDDRFIDGIMIETAPIESIEGQIYRTKHNSYWVELIGEIGGNNG